MSFDAAQYAAVAVPLDGADSLPAEARAARLPMVDVRVPHAALGPLDVRVRVECCAVCHTDMYTRAPGRVPGHEAVGVVVERGADVTDDVVRLGQRVGCAWLRSACMKCEDCLDGAPNACAQARKFDAAPAGFGEFTVYDARFVYPIPDGLRSEDAAPLLCAGVTMYAPLARYGAGPGKRVGVIGIGGLGHLGLMFARALGAHVVALSSSARKRDEALEFGAHEYVDTSDAAALDALEPLHIILSTVSADLDWTRLLRALRPRGTLVVMGVPPHPIAFASGPLILGQRAVAGSIVGSPAEVRATLEFAAAHNIRPRIELDELSAAGVLRAFAKMDDNSVRYRTVLQRTPSAL